MNRELIVILQAIKTKACKSEWNEQALAARTYSVIVPSKLRCGIIAQKHLCLKAQMNVNKIGIMECVNCPMSSYTAYAHNLIIKVTPYEWTTVTYSKRTK